MKDQKAGGLLKSDMVEILYYTDNRLDGTLLGNTVKKHILKSGLPIISVSLLPIDFGRNIHHKGRRSHSTMFRQVKEGLEESKAENIIICEHDVLYHKSHFDFVPPKKDVYYYNNNVIKYVLATRKAVSHDCTLFSQCIANRKLLLQHYTTKLDMLKRKIKAYGFEPGTGQCRKIDGYEADTFESSHPNIDIIHKKNFTPKKIKLDWQSMNIKDIKGWDSEELWELK